MNREDMSKEQMKILEMLDAEKITAEEATKLLEALKVPAVYTGEPVAYEERFSEQIPAQETSAIDVSHTHGHITVKGWDKDEIKLEGTKSVKAIDYATAQKFAELMKVEIESHGDQVTVRTLRPEPEASWQIRDRTINYELYAPHRCNVVLKNQHGKTHIDHFSGTLDVDNQHGHLHVEDIGDNTVIQHQHGHVDIAGIHSDTSVQKKHGNLKIKEVHGHVKLRHEHGHVDIRNIDKTVNGSKQHGHMDLTDIGGSVQLDHNHGHLQLQHIGGGVELNKNHGNVDVMHIQSDLLFHGNHGNMTIDDVAGSADIEHAHGRVKLENVKERVSIRNRHGHIDVTAPRSVSQPYRLETGHANLKLLIPDDARVDLSAQTGHGHITSDLLTIKKQRHSESAEGHLNGGGVAFELSNNHGNIQVETAVVSEKN